MGLSDIEMEAGAHRAAVVTLLRSHLPHGRRAQAAKAVSISPSYLSRVLSDRPYSEKRHGTEPRLEPLGPELAARLAAWLGLDARSRDQLLEHAQRSHESTLTARIEIRTILRDPGAILPELLKLHSSANAASNAYAASILYTTLYRTLKQVIESINPRSCPLEFAQMCLVLNDLEAVLNYNIDGIYHAQLAKHWISVCGKKRSILLDKSAEDLWENALVAEAISVHNLGLDSKAISLLSSKDLTKRRSVWSGEAVLHRLKCIASLERTSLRQVDELADEYLNLVEKFGSRTDDALTQFALSEAKLRSYLSGKISKTNLKKADAELSRCLAKVVSSEPEENRVFEFTNGVSALRAVIFLNTYSKLLNARGDSVQAEKVRRESASRAVQAGLAHQLTKLGVKHSLSYY